MASPTYADFVTLVKDATFIDRISIAIENYAKSILGEAASTVGHVNRMRWAINNINNSLLSTGPAYQIATIVAKDPIFSTQSPIVHTSVTDAQFQAAVEAAINSTILG